MNKEDQSKLVSLLKKLDPGFYPLEIFMQMARLNTLSIIEFVPVWKNEDGVVEVLLLNREENDKLFAGELHTPGTVIRPTDSDGKKYLAFERILKDELANTKVSAPYFVGSILHKSKRGTEHAQVYWVEVQEKPKLGKMYRVDSLPNNIMQSQISFIQLAVNNYEKTQGLTGD